MSESIAVNSIPRLMTDLLSRRSSFRGIKVGDETKKMMTLTAFLLPALIPMVIFIFYPLIKSFILSVHMTNARGEMVRYVGLQNFRELFTSRTFIESVKTTAVFSFFTTFFSVIISVFLALLANEKIKGIAFFRTIFSSTLGVSVSAGSTIWLFMYHPSIGIVNSFLNKIGLNSINWLTDSKYALTAVIITTIWMEVGFGFLVITAGLNNISEDIYESARIDGASYFRQLINITLPLLTPSLYYLVTVSTIKSLQSFGQIHVLTGGGPSISTTTLVYRLWSTAFLDYRFGFASVIGLVLSAAIIIITIIQVRMEKKVHYQ